MELKKAIYLVLNKSEIPLNVKSVASIINSLLIYKQEDGLLITEAEIIKEAKINSQMFELNEKFISLLN